MALSNSIILAFFLKPPISLPYGVLLVKAAVPIALLALYWKAYDEIPILAIIPDLISATTNTFKPTNWKATAFSIYIVKFASMGIMFSVFPAMAWKLFFGLSVDFFGAQLTRQCGMYAGALAVAGFTLKDGADRYSINLSILTNLQSYSPVILSLTNTFADAEAVWVQVPSRTLH